MYRYSLDRTSRKFICPQCGKKTFVKYTDNESGNYLQEKFGRCDRESKCQYHLKPNGNKPIVDILNIVKQESSCLKYDAVIQSLQNIKHDNFIKYLLQFFTWEEVKTAIIKYNIGNCDYWNGSTVFWQMDQERNLSSGKIMKYDKYTGKRIKKPFPHINWIHKVYPIKDFVLQQHLYGIHNLCDYKKGSTICVVESEKTAIIMSLLSPNYLWLATGSKSNFKEELLKPLKSYNVIVYPDKSEYTDWYTKSETLNNKGYTIKCSKFIEDKTNKEGADLIDLILEN